MPEKPDYKSAYMSLTRAIEEACQILIRASVMSSAGLQMQEGKEVEKIDMELIRLLNEINGPA